MTRDDRADSFSSRAIGNTVFSKVAPSGCTSSAILSITLRVCAHSWLASATSWVGEAVKIGGACGGIWYRSGAIVEEMMGLVAVQAGLVLLTAGLILLRKDVSRGPNRRVEARTRVIPMNRIAERTRNRRRERIARLSICRAAVVRLLYL